MSNAARTRPLELLPQAVADLFELEDLAEVLFAAYLRVSYDPHGNLRSNTEQFGDLNAIFARRPKWKLDTVYDDEEGSASPYRKKERKDFARLMDDLRTGNFAAHVIAVWEASRGAREVAMWDQFLRLCEQRGIIIFVTSMKKFFDPRNPVDWNDLQQMGVKAEFEVRQSRQRVKRATDANLVRGEWCGGRRPFGYDSDGRTVRDGTTPEGGLNERQLIVDAVNLILGGASVRSIAADWTERGIRTPGTKNNPDGNRWRPDALRKMLVAPRLAGHRVVDGVVISKEAWEAIIPESKHNRLVAVINSRTGPGRRGRPPRLLTGLLFCDCGAPLVGNSHAPGKLTYCCRSGFNWNGCGKVAITAQGVEETLGVMVTERLDDIVARRDRQSQEDDAEEFAELDRIAAWREEADEDRYKLKKIARAEYDRRMAHFDAMQRDVEARIAAKTRSAAAAVDFLVAEGLIGKPWEECTTEEKRRKITAVINSVSVGPATRRGAGVFERARITRPGRIDWKDL